MIRNRLFLLFVVGITAAVSGACTFEQLDQFINNNDTLLKQCDTIPDSTVKSKLVFCIDSSSAIALQMASSFMVSSKTSVGDTLKKYAGLMNKLKPHLQEAVTHPIARLWYKSLVTTIGSDARDVYTALIEVQHCLLKRKYFGVNQEEANLLDGWVNSHLAFTRTFEPNVTSGSRLFGVSPYEVTLFRIEPLALWSKDKTSAGGIISLGITEHFFPKVGILSECTPKMKETFASLIIRSLGLRVGIGAYSTEPRYMAGCGILIHSFVFWGLIDINDKNTRFIGTSVSLRTLLKLFG